jgi:2-dehydro-3-deoxygalactonokinase
MTAEPVRPDWIALDWGTTHLRAWAMAAAGPLAERGSGDGMGRLARDGFETALLALIGDWLDPARATPALACGMVGSRQGWFEAPYRAVPCPPLDPGAMVAVPVADPRLSLRIVPGLKQAAPPDVMRGEETQIAGALACAPGFDGVICLPGTHSKWTQVSAGEVASFQTAMTGEVFALLSEQSVLRHAMPGEGWDDAAFDSALSDALSRPERLAARLFGIRAEGLLAGLTPGAARARLSGLLIGAELAGARAYWLGQPVAVIGESGLSALYARALAAQGAPVRQWPARDTVLAGLAAARAAMLEDHG